MFDIHIFLTFVFHLVIAVAKCADALDLNELLAQCEKEQRVRCYVPDPPNTEEIDQLLTENVELRYFMRQTWQVAENSIGNLIRFRRQTTANGIKLCEVNKTRTEPFNFMKDNDGWHQVAESDQFPQRTTFAEENCLSEGTPCQFVESSLVDREPLCQQEHSQHIILTWDSKINSLKSRYIDIKSGCKCQLAHKPRNLFAASIGNKK